MASDVKGRRRILEILRDLLISPGHYGVKDFIQRYQKSRGTILADFEFLREAGFDVRYDHNHRYYIKPDRAYDQLQEALYLSESEIEKLIAGLDQSAVPEKSKARIEKKLHQLFDLAKVGGAIYSQAYIQKVNALLQAKEDKQQVVLYNYFSANSQSVKDRTLEVFYISTQDDLLVAYEVASQQVKHFKISRFERLKQLDQDWEHETKHWPATPDVFGYVSKNNVKLYLKLNLAGYLRMVAIFPRTKGHWQPCPTDPQVMELECAVNAEFNGLRQFLLSQHAEVVEIVYPPLLIQQLNADVQKINFLH